MPGLWATLCVCWLVYSIAHQLRVGSDHFPTPFDLLPLTHHSPHASLPAPIPRELPLTPWWKRRACWAVAVSPRAAGQHHFDLHIRTDANSSAMPPLGVITSCRPCPCQVGVSWCGGGLFWSTGKCYCPISRPCSFTLCLTSISVIVASKCDLSFQVFGVMKYVVVLYWYTVDHQ